MVIAASAFVSALFKAGCILGSNFVSHNNFESTRMHPRWHSEVTHHTRPDKVHEWSSGQVGACSQLIGPGPSPGVITVTGPSRVTQSCQYLMQNIHAARHSSGHRSRLIISPGLSCHTVARHISSLPDLGPEIPRIKIHFRLHFLFNNHQVQTKLETTFNKNSNYSTLGRADMITT